MLRYDNFKLQKAILNHPHLTSAEKLISLAIAHYRNSTNGDCFPSQQKIAIQTCFSRKHVNETVKKLKEKGVLKVEYSKLSGSRKRVSNYVFLL